MRSRDRYHDVVRRALEKDGWTITEDPLRMRWGKKDMYVDLSVIKRVDPNQKLYLAIHEEVYDEFFTEPLGEILLSDYQVPLLVFDPDQEVIVQWID